MSNYRQLSNTSRTISARPYQLLCLVCRLSARLPPGTQLGRLRKIIRENPSIPIRLVCNVDALYRYQNPGHALDSAGGDLFNEKRDLDILQKMGLSPGDTRPARDLIERLLKSVKTVRDICGGAGRRASATWRGCALAGSGAFERAHAKAFAALIPARSAREKAAAKRSTAAAIYRAKELNIRPHHLMCMACFYSRQKFAPIAEDNLFEALDVMRKNPAIPVTLIRGCCMICPPCSAYDRATGLCTGAHGMGLRDQKKDLDVLKRLGLNYGATLPAKVLYQRLFQRIRSAKEICGLESGEAWTSCGTAAQKAYERSRASGMGIVRKKFANWGMSQIRRRTSLGRS